MNVNRMSHLCCSRHPSLGVGKADLTNMAISYATLGVTVMTLEAK